MYVVKNARNHRNETFASRDAARDYAQAQILVSRAVNLGTRVERYAVWDDKGHVVAVVAAA